MGNPKNKKRAAASWQLAFFERHVTDDPDRSVPARAFLTHCPEKVRATMLGVLEAVRRAPPPSFSGGGYWEAMHGEMSGYYEVRVNGPKREHFRLFCILDPDDAAKKLGAPSIVLIDGASKPFLTTLLKKDYRAIRVLGDEYMKRTPRSIAR